MSLRASTSQTIGPFLRIGLEWMQIQDLAPYPTTMRVFDNCMKLEAFDLAQPSKQPDAE